MTERRGGAARWPSMKCGPLSVALAFAAAACSPAADGEPAAEPDNAVPSAETRQALAAADIEAAALAGELGCAFAEEAARAPLLVATANVRDEARADGLVQVGGSAVRLNGAESGGFNALLDGARFIAGDLVATVAVTSPEPLGEGESPPRAATLTLESPASASDRIAGQWTCGP